jgi:hypothetical protein
MLSFLNHLWKRLLQGNQRFFVPKKSPSVERGQVLVIMIISFTALLAFVGMVADIGAVYVTFTQLKRAVDSAAVAAANNIKNPDLTYTERKTQITEAAREMLAFHNVTDIASLEAYICEDTGLPAEFDAACPDVGAGESARKLAWIQATQNVPVYFLSLFGIESVPLTTRSIGEAATVDLVIVIDTSESMGDDSPGYDGGLNFNPSACNANDTCEPLKQAKNAAKDLVDAMFEGYDQISVVQYDFNATYYPLNDDFTVVKNNIDAITLHNDLDANIYSAYGSIGAGDMNPFDVDGDGLLGDADNVDTGVDDEINDSFLSTCTGCGIRVAGTILKHDARPNSVWVIVFLADGATNVSDIPPEVNASSYPNGFCFGSLGSRMWTPPFCQDNDPTIRHCGGPYRSSASECPPDDIDNEVPWDEVIWVGTDGIGGDPGEGTGFYDVEDYAYDMVDEVALTASTNPNEPITGNDIVIYSIALGQAADSPYLGEELLRYMANVGDDGTRLNDPCAGVAHQEQCGNYYYAPGPSYLSQIFESIAARIYTRISY